ncbi:MAG: hypothetical protein AAF394_05585 [Planctomycetota bacterium]
MNTAAIKTSVEPLIKAYGPSSFGLVVLLTIWWVVVQPQLDRLSLDFESQKALMKSQEELMDKQEATVSALHTTANVLDRVTERIERLDRGG